MSCLNIIKPILSFVKKYAKGETSHLHCSTLSKWIVLFCLDFAQFIVIEFCIGCIC